MATSVLNGHNKLPRRNNVGQRSIWTLPISQSEPIVISARFIGTGSSERHRHQNHLDDAEFAQPKQHCNACRWFETRIFRLVELAHEEGGLAGANYLLHHSGVSIVPGEVVHYRYEAVRSAHEVIEAFTVRKNSPAGVAQPPFLTRPAARALAQAAGFDAELEHAYTQRATA
jgi:hypothetical protein